MKKPTLLAVGLGLAMGLLSAPAHAQSGAVKVTVPFHFYFAGKNLPPGNYTMIAGPRRVSIEDVQRKMVAMVQAIPASDGTAGATGKAIFRCSSNQCFLSELWSPDRDSGLQLVPTRSEAQWAKKEATKYLALQGDSQH